MKKLLFIFVCTCIFFSCSQDEMDSILDNEQHLSTRSLSSNPLDQLVNIPVNIVQPAGLSSSNEKYLSTQKNDATCDLWTSDDDSGRQKWILSGSYPRYTISVVGGSHNNYKNFNIAGKTGNFFPSLSNTSHTFTFEEISSNNTYRIYTPSYGYLETKSYNNSGLNFYHDRKTNYGMWEIRPIEEYILEDITYSLSPDDKIIPMPDFFEEVEVKNNGDILQTMNVQYSQSATESSKFSKTIGLSLTIGASVSVGVPILAGGSLNVSQTTSTTWSYEKAESKGDTRTYNFKLDVPARSTYRAKVMVSIYSASATYTAYYRSKSGRPLVLSGKWTGLKAGTIRYEIYNGGTLIRSFNK